MLSGHSDFKIVNTPLQVGFVPRPCFVRSLPARAFRKRGRRGSPDRQSARHTPPRAGDAVMVSRSVGAARLVLALSSLADLKGPVHPLLRRIPGNPERREPERSAVDILIVEDCRRQLVVNNDVEQVAD